MNNLVIPNNLPQVQFSADLVARAQNMLQSAVQNMASAPPRLSFGGRSFNLTAEGATIEIQDRVLDVHLVAIDSRHHYVFYEKDYAGADVDSGKVMARYPNDSDSFEFTPTAEWRQRAYKHRAVVMLANDPNHRLYVTDFGYNTCRRTGNVQLGLLNLGQLITQLNYFAQQNQALLPFLFTVQMSFTKESVPEVQFSLFDQRNPGSQEVRFATTAAVNAMQEAFANGTVDNLMKVEFTAGGASTRAPNAQVVPTLPQAAPQAQPQAQPQVAPQQPVAGFSGIPTL